MQTRRNSAHEVRTFVVASIVLVLSLFVSHPQTTTNSQPVNVIVRDLIEQNGGKTNELPVFAGPLSALREIKKDEYGAQIVFAGDQMEALLKMLSGVYGNAVYVRTNNVGKTMFQYNKNQMGVGLSCMLHTPNSGPVTQLVILGPKGLAAISGSFGGNSGEPKARSPEEARAIAAAIKAAVDRGSSGDLDAIATQVKLGWLVGVYRKSQGAIKGNVGTAAVDNNFHVVDFESSADAPK